MTVVSLRDYAKDKSVSYEAVRKQVARYKDELAGHIIMDGRQQFLDEEAVAFLDGKRQKNPVVIYEQSKDEAIEGLRRSIEMLQAERAELYKWKADNAVAIAEANHTQLLLDGTKAELEAAKRDAAEKAEELGFAQQEADAAKKRAEEAKEAEERALAEKNAWAEYAAALEAYNALGWWKRRKAEKPQPPKEE